MTQYRIALLPGDGIGPEVTAAAVQVLNKIGNISGHAFSFQQQLIGGCAMDTHGTALTDETIRICQQSDAVLLGAVGGPKWDDPNAAIRPEQGLLKLRKALDVFANLRPVTILPPLAAASPLKPEKLIGIDLLVVRELTGGIYFGEPKSRSVVDGVETAVDTMRYNANEIRRVVELAFELAKDRRRKIISVDKANVLESSRLWRKITTEVAVHHPDITLEHMLVDTAAMRLIQSPADIDVLVTGNMFGDILTDEASVLSGSMGMLPSASLGKGGPGLYEPIHGSAPDIAGKGIANPLGAILSMALMLRYSLNLTEEAARVEAAVDKVIADGHRTVDLGGKLGTVQITDLVLSAL
ncbi:MAG: 3-isopropylmalate dehydrogenase [Anaerolineaceae bacterium]|jgi:3-isopropylmalate dehydrogenase|nr:3-isopropylmalate dehydrogenase [Anaerolineaceae bacterium]